MQVKKKTSLSVTKATHTHTWSPIRATTHDLDFEKKNATKKYKRACYFGIISYSSTQKMFIKERRERLGVL